MRQSLCKASVSGKKRPLEAETGEVVECCSWDFWGEVCWVGLVWGWEEMDRPRKLD